MKSILMSIQPYWVFLIIAKTMGWNYPKEKTVEVRKTYPQNKCWNRIVKIYCSKNKKSFNRIPKDYQPLMEKFLGKVVGEFVCDKTDIYDDDIIHSFSHEDYCRWNDFDLKRSCMHPEDFENYAADKWLYGWHISDLKIYDKPKELSEFYILCEESLMNKTTAKCKRCQYHRNESEMSLSNEQNCVCNGVKPITRPPQSYCYVEEQK